jgi:quercetin dioxygenase-like cupin family protein
VPYNEWEQVNDLIRRKRLAPGERMMSMLVEFKSGGFGPEHSHPHEQLGYVISGKIEMKIAGVSRTICAGEQVYIAGNIAHSVMALENTLLLETFTPLRDDLLDK